VSAPVLGELSKPKGKTTEISCAKKLKIGFNQQVSYNITGKVLSLTSSLEALAPVAAAPLYTYVYKATYLTVPGAVYMLSSGLYILNFGFFM
jgi:hypothetical protein